MIAELLGLITDELNSFLGRKEPRYRNVQTAVLSDLVNQQGELVITTDDHSEQEGRDNVIVTLINVEEETVGKAQLPYIRSPEQSIGLVNPEIKLNLYVLFSTFSNMNPNERYLNCLKLLSYVVRFFQYKNVFNHQNTPNLSEDIDKLTIELVSPTFEQQNYLWGALGAKYMPSVLYKVRMLTIREVEESIPSRLIEQVRINELSQS